jgi:serine/threonine protein kinase
MIIHRQKATGYGYEVDWWALGIVCFELLVGHPPFFDRDFSKLCTKILTKPIIFPSLTSKSSSTASSLPNSSRLSEMNTSSTSSSSSKSKGLLISQIAQDFVYSLLQRDRSHRLCCGTHPDLINYSFTSLQRHEFFIDIDWNLLSKEVFTQSMNSNKISKLNLGKISKISLPTVCDISSPCLIPLQSQFV